MNHNDNNDNLRNWMDTHPKSSLYVAFMVTVIFFMQVYEVIRILF